MLCTSVKNSNAQSVLEATYRYPFVEIRLDDYSFADDEIKAMFSKSQAKTIATCRNEIITDNQKLDRLKLAIDSGANCVDIEIDYPFAEQLAHYAQSHNCEIIASEHNFDAPPTTETIESAATTAKTIGADYFKIACKCNSESECLRMLNLYSNKNITKLFQKKLISLPIGNEWRFARIATLSLGSPFIYVAADSEAVTADGQIAYGKLLKILEMVQ